MSFLKCLPQSLSLYIWRKYKFKHKLLKKPCSVSLSMPAGLLAFVVFCHFIQVLKFVLKSWSVFEVHGLEVEGFKGQFWSFLTEQHWCFWNFVTPSSLKSCGKIRLLLGVFVRKRNCCFSGEDKQKRMREELLLSNSISNGVLKRSWNR